MGKINTESLVLHGVGEAVLLDQNGKASATLMRLQNMNIEITAEFEDVYGGDSLFPFFNYIKSKSATFRFKDATFNMDILAATQGSEVVEGGEAFGSENLEVKTDSATLSITTGVIADSVAIIANGKALKRVEADATPETGEFKASEAGQITFASGEFEDGAIVHVSYVYTVAEGTSVHVKTDDVAGYVELRHISNPTELKDGRLVQVHTRVYKAKCDGGFNLEQTRDGATAPEVTFKSVDPERADKRFVSYSVVEVKK